MATKYSRFLISLVIISALVREFRATSFMKSKQIGCGQIEVDEDYQEPEEAHRHQPRKTAKSSSNPDFKLIVNLTECLLSINEANYTSFATYIDSKLASQIFETNFHLNDSNGLVYMKRKIDRELLCADARKEANSMVNCDCKSEKCELSFKFIGFKEKHLSATKRRRIQVYQSNIQEYKYLNLKVIVRDLNDHRPKFVKNFLSINISENFGTKPESNTSSKLECETQNPNLNMNVPKNGEQVYSLLKLEKAFDMDAGKNAIIKYRLVLLRSQEFDLIDEFESQANPILRVEKIKHLIANDGVRPCFDYFELVESVKLNDEFLNYEAAHSENDHLKKIQRQRINNEQLFLKINKHLDREAQKVYNLVLVASEDKPENVSFDELINKQNFLFVRLLVTDLNDNQPKFNDSKYSFHIDEATENKIYYSKDIHDTANMYFEFLNETCFRLKNALKVNAYDLDDGLNSVIKYKIIHQKHLKNPNVKMANFQISKVDRFNEGSEINTDSAFHVNPTTGSIYLLFCELLEDAEFNKSEIDREKFVKLTNLLDFESYVKHILVVEASNPNSNTPLQSVVTVEINLIDLNDHQPLIIGLYSKECSKFDSAYYTSQEINQNGNLNITVESLNNSSFSTRITIGGLIENSGQLGRCLGQFLIHDSDTPSQNKHIEAVIRPNFSHRISDSNFTFANLKARYSSTRQIQKDIFYEVEHPSGIVHGRNMSLSSSNLHVQTNEIFELFINIDIDAETQNVYDLVIELKDSGRPLSLKSFAQLIVHIDDLNDNPPRFTKSVYNFTIDEWNELTSTNESSQVVGDVCLGRVEAVDIDVTQENSAVRYSIDLNETKVETRFKAKRDSLDFADDEKNFYIDSKSGHVCVKNRRLLDRERRSKYEFLIKATNKNSSIYSTVPCFVTIRDVNDNPPEFLHQEYKFYVAERDSNMVNALFIVDDFSKPAVSRSRPNMIYIGTVKATDRDAHSELFYFIDPGNEKYKAYFELNTDSLENGNRNDFVDFVDSKENDVGAANIDESNVYDIEDVEFSDNTVYEVSAIKLRPSQTDLAHSNLTEYVFNYKDDSKNTNENFIIGAKRKALKPIDDISEYIYINSSTGVLFLLNNIDREKILNLKFTVFVRDKKLPEGALVNQVAVTVEIIDINDSKPTCFSSVNSNEIDADDPKPDNEERNLLDSFAIRFDLEKLSTIQSPDVGSYELARIYKFKCVDNDMNKNARIKYHIDGYFLRDANRLGMTTVATTSIKPRRRSKSNKRIREQHDDFENFISTYKVFVVNSASGVVYLNLTLDWSPEADFFKKLTSLVDKKFVLVKVRVSDCGMVSLYRDYFLRLYFCFRDKFDSSDEYCDFSHSDAHRNRTILLKQLIVGLEDELKNDQLSDFGSLSSLPDEIDNDNEKKNIVQLKPDDFTDHLEPANEEDLESEMNHNDASRLSSLLSLKLYVPVLILLTRRI